MKKNILVTGSTDGIGLETAKILISSGHHVLIHGRDPSKLRRAVEVLSEASSGGRIESFEADLSRPEEVVALAETVADRYDRLDVLINNAGVYNASEPWTKEGLDVRFVVNTLAPYLLTLKLLPRLETLGRVINLSSAAQASVNLRALAGEVRLNDGAAYAQSKLALTMWSRHLALSLGKKGPVLIAVNPGSMLGTKMVQQAFGVAGGDVYRGAEVLRRAAVNDEFVTASGQYFDNDSGRFASPHPDALDAKKCAALVQAMEAVLERWLSSPEA